MNINDFLITAHLPMLKLIPSFNIADIQNSTIRNSPHDLQALNQVFTYTVAPRPTDPTAIQFHTAPYFSTFWQPIDNQPGSNYLCASLLAHTSTQNALEIGYFTIIIGRLFETIELAAYTATRQKFEKIHIQNHQQIIRALKELNFPFQI